MRIADEIDYVMREFVACEDVFNALIEEQELELYQIASWMERHEEKIVRVQMIECDLVRRDFRLLDEGWIRDAITNIRLDGDAYWNSDVSIGSRPGWLRTEIKEFFKATKVDFPEAALASPGNRLASPAIPASLSATPFAHSETPGALGDMEKAIGTRERTTLLTILAALAEEAKISLVTPSKSAELIAGMTERMGSPVAKRTIEEHLKKVTDALERKSR